MTDCDVHVTGGDLSKEEIDAYKAHAYKQYGCSPESIDIHVDGDYVDLKYHFRSARFDRIRRITGYLVGTIDRWNDAKKAEEHDRVKHGVTA